MSEVKARSYTLRNENGGWIGQVVLTSDGMYSSVTDWGNCSYAWRSYGEKDFREFLIDLNPDYFAGKMRLGLVYMIKPTRELDRACDRYAREVLPALQKMLREELANNIDF